MDSPECADRAPDLSGGIELLKRLLAVEIDRLETAVRIEKERKIVFPETSVIIRDIQKLQATIYGRSHEANVETIADWPEVLALKELL